MRPIEQIEKIIARAEENIDIDLMKARFGFEFAERTLDSNLLSYKACRYTAGIAEEYIQLYKRIFIGYETINNIIKKEE